MSTLNYTEIHRTTLIGLELTWGVRPISVLACAGYADEHWQIFHPAEYTQDQEPMPRVTIDIEGHVAYHMNVEA